MFITNSLLLPIYDAEFHKDPFLDLFLLFLLYINDLLQAVDCDLFLYVDNTCLLLKHKDLGRIKRKLTKNFFNICDWFVDNKLSIPFGEDKTKSILFFAKNRKRKVGTLGIQYGDVKIKQ